MNLLHKPLALSIALVHSGLAMAQEQQDTDTTLAANTLEEVTVTATKRETNLMETPISITAFSQEKLDREGLTNIKDMAQMVPNMEISMDSSQTAPVVAMRGVRSTNITELGDPSVGLHLDGIYSPRPQGAMALMFDVERVEAMRGPQGTLFGRNSTVGNVNIISKRPDFNEFDASVGVEAGRWNHQQTRGMVNLPVSDTFAVRASFMQETRDSYLRGYYDPNQWDVRYLPEEIQNAPVYTGADEDRSLRQRERWGSGEVQELVKADPADFYNNSDQYAFRVSALWEPSESLSWMLAYEQFQDDSAGGTDTMNCDMADKRIKKDWDGNYVDADGNISATPVTGLLGCESVYGPGADDYTVAVSVPGFLDLSIDSVRSNLSWDVSEEIALIYNAGWAEQVRSQHSDQDRGITGWDMSIFFRDATFVSQSHELQLQSTGSGPLQWIAGAFYFEEDNNMQGGWINSGNNADYWNQPARTLKSQAFFTQGTYALTDQLNLTLGLRYTEDSKQDVGGRNMTCNGDTINPQTGERCFPAWDRDAYNQLPTDYFDDPAIYTAVSDNQTEGSWDFTNYRIGLDYILNDDLMVFGYVANGFKSGGIGDVFVQYEQDPTTAEYLTDTNGDRVIKERHQNTYDPEIVTTYELGTKGTFMDGSLNLMATLFYSDYEDMQAASARGIFPFYVEERDEQTGELTGEITTETQTVFQTENIGRAAIKGFEVEFDWAPIENGRFDGYVTWLDTEITSDFVYHWGFATTDLFEVDHGTATNPENDALKVNLKGNDLAASPKLTAKLNYTHTFRFNNGFALVPHVSYYWRDKSYHTFHNVDKHYEVFATETPDAFSDVRPAFHSVNTTLKLEAPDNQWNIEAFAYNVTDQRQTYWAGGGDGLIKGPVSMPRFYGLRANYNF
ncbi:TonB-dependent receptor [Microbulbifer agarilyticus]|uniref:TonB-dependent receptor n=1 Tax=Microbulbifer agarilyticus TaxID=260552 RepID=UPI001C96CE14|nr:TonB-dependent receptor [Microbulbifer agarilyticus]MBY6188855.1 TonB-dependent receptor [Microbulbifer agarilyticus]